MSRTNRNIYFFFLFLLGVLDEETILQEEFFDVGWGRGGGKGGDEKGPKGVSLGPSLEEGNFFKKYPLRHMFSIN